jgi:hypothetical protein
MRHLHLPGFVFLATCFVAPMSGSAGERAMLKAGEQTIALGRTAEFPIASSSAQSSELSAWCELSAAGRATLTFDGDRYVPLSEPAVGDVVTLSPNEKRRIELHGTVEANEGDAYVAFIFSDVPAALCFPGMQCDGVSTGARDVRVLCGND